MVQLEYGLQELPLLTQKLRSYLINNQLIVLLRGDLSSGKTSIVKAFVAHFDPTISVTSPTFAIMHEYDISINSTPLTIYHYDLYRKEWQELVALGFWDMVAQQGIHFIEWSCDPLEQTLRHAMVPVIVMQIVRTAAPQERLYTIKRLNEHKVATKAGNASA